MKKIVFCLNNLDYGGIETAFLNLTNKIDYQKYEVTLILERKEGVFLNNLDKRVKVIDYNVSDSKNILKRKITNRLKLITFILKNYHKYDFAANYATGRIVGSILSRYLSKNNCLFVHGNIFEDDYHKKAFLKRIKAPRFKKIVFVSNDLKRKYLKLVPNTKQKLYVSNNMINAERIIRLSTELEIKNKKTTLIHIGRHQEEEKNIMMLLEVIKKLKDLKYDFQVYLIGDGDNHLEYIEKAKELGIEDYVIFKGSLPNPYPYLKASDALVLTSKLEGNPVVFLEAMVLNIPIITTNVSDSKEIIDKKYGLVSKVDIDSYSDILKKFLDKGFKIKEPFDYFAYNEQVLKNIEKVIEDK